MIPKNCSLFKSRLVLSQWLIQNSLNIFTPWRYFQFRVWVRAVFLGSFAGIAHWCGDITFLIYYSCLFFSLCCVLWYYFVHFDYDFIHQRNISVWCYFILSVSNADFFPCSLITSFVLNSFLFFNWSSVGDIFKLFREMSCFELRFFAKGNFSLNNS